MQDDDVQPVHEAARIVEQRPAHCVSMCDHCKWLFFCPICWVSTQWLSSSNWLARGERRSRCVHFCAMHSQCLPKTVVTAEETLPVFRNSLVPTKCLTRVELTCQMIIPLVPCMLITWTGGHVFLSFFSGGNESLCAHPLTEADLLCQIFEKQIWITWSICA